MFGKTGWVFSVFLTAELVLRSTHPVVGKEVLRITISEDEGTEECAALQLRTSLGADGISSVLPASQGNLSQLGSAALPVATAAVVGEPGELLRAASTRSALALLGGARVRAEQSRVRAQLDRARAENSRALAEAARLREDGDMLERRLAVQREVAGRGAVAFSFAYWCRHWWLVLSAVLGLAFVTFVAYVIYRRCTRRVKRKKKNIDSMGAFGGSVGTDVDQASADADGEQESNMPYCCQVVYCCFCGCSVQARVSVYSVLLLWSTGIAVLWHFGVVQPFLRQLALVAMLVVALMAIVCLSAYEAWVQAQGKLHMAVAMLDFMHDKINNLLTHMGFTVDESPSNAGDDKEQSTKQGGQ